MINVERIQSHDLSLALHHWPSARAVDGEREALSRTASNKTSLNRAHLNKAPLLVGLHGWLDNAMSFSRLASSLNDLLAETRDDALNDVALCALDLPGHGASSHLPPSSDYSVWHSLPLLDHCLEVLKRRTQRPLVLVGHSLGASIAQLYAALFSDRLQALVCIDGPGPLVTPDAHFVAQLKSAVEADRRVSRAAMVYPSVDHAVEARLKANSYLSGESIRAVVAHNLKRLDDDRDGWMWRTDPRLRRPSRVRLSEVEVADTLAAITVPVLMIRAQHSVANDALWQQRLSYFKPAAQLEVSTLSGHHHLHLDASSCHEVAKRMCDFLARIT